MQITEKYLNRFKLAFATPADLLALVPEEITLSGFEQVASSSITLDLPPDSNLPQAISIIHRDENPDDSELWELDDGKRQTLVIPQPPAGIGYLFAGLLAPADARLWCRNRLGFEAEQEGSDP